MARIRGSWTVLMLVVAVAAGCGEDKAGDPAGGRSATEPTSSPAAAALDLETVYDDCLLEISFADKQDGPAFSLGDNDQSLIITSAPMAVQEYVDAFTCLLDGLGPSDALRSQILSTTNGTEPQQASEKGLDYRWSLSSTGSLSMTVTVTG